MGEAFLPQAKTGKFSKISRKEGVKCLLSFSVVDGCGVGGVPTYQKSGRYAHDFGVKGGESPCPCLGGVGSNQEKPGREGKKCLVSFSIGDGCGVCGVPACKKSGRYAHDLGGKGGESFLGQAFPTEGGRSKPKNFRNFGIKMLAQFLDWMWLGGVWCVCVPKISSICARFGVQRG